jgi:hypothetical protein
MIVCPNCHHQEMAGTLFCSECGTKLTEGDSLLTRSIETSTSKLTGRPKKTPSTPLPPHLLGTGLSLHILDSGQIIPLSGREEFTLGRSAEGQTILPDVDLASYRAYEKGVSRMHASIKLTGQQITVTDLGSVNGTRLNGKKIPSHQSHPLNHGDILTLGKLKVQILTRK